MILLSGTLSLFILSTFHLLSKRGRAWRACHPVEQVWAVKRASSTLKKKKTERESSCEFSIVLTTAQLLSSRQVSNKSTGKSHFFLLQIASFAQLILKSEVTPRLGQAYRWTTTCYSNLRSDLPSCCLSNGIMVLQDQGVTNQRPPPRRNCYNNSLSFRVHLGLFVCLLVNRLLYDYWE